MTALLAIKSQYIEPEKIIFNLPSDLQYKIFELSGISIPPDLFRKSLSGFRIKYYDYEIKKSHNYFLMKEKNNSPAGIAWKKTMQAIETGKVSPPNSQLETVGLALKTLSKGLSPSERKEFKDLWGAYSLNIKKIKAIEQIILDKSLRLLFNGTQQFHELPRNLPENEFKKWLANPENEDTITNVTTIAMNSNDEQDNIIPDEIMKFKSLVGFKFKYSNIYSIEPLKVLPELNFLDLFNNQITDISPLRTLGNLTALGLNDNQITDISPLSNLRNLTDLGLNDNQITDISPLSSLTRLNKLYLNNNQITDISALRPLRNLSILALNNNQIDNISDLEDLTNLIRVYLKDNQITDVLPLRSLTNLLTLDLNDNHIIDISPLRSLINLSHLYLKNNQVTCISALSPLRYLIILALNNNQITDISPLSSLISLFQLYLNDNKIISIAALSPIRNLRILTIKNNQITDFSPLRSLTNLTEVT